ncbi:MAG: hypothetical protein IJ555_03365, partial [Ruminococcus sp.]|nr:hypothetical protein [Ruminococcus sp.]
GLSGYIQNILLLTADINSADYKLTPEGFFYGASGMKLTCCELERIGLYLLRRSYESSGYLSHALSKQIDTPTGGYGFYFWLEDGCICISGKWGQKCIISKEQGSVISYLSTGQQADNTLYTLALNAKLC